MLTNRVYFVSPGGGGRNGRQIKRVNTRNSVGGGVELTLMITLAGIAVPSLKAVVLEVIKARRYKSVSFKGVKFTGHDAKDIDKSQIASAKQA